MGIVTAEIEFAGGAPAGEVYCPACGAPITTVDVEAEACVHLVYVFYDEVGEFSFVRREYQVRVDAWLEDEHDDRHPVERLAALMATRTVLHLALTSRGIACGPYSSTARVGIDFGRRGA